jgi:Flp pilus assembly protein TadD
MAAGPQPAVTSLEFDMTSLNIAAALVGGAVLLSPSAAVAVDEMENPAAVQLDPDYAAGKKAIEAKQWSAAIAALSSAALRDTRNADIQNYLGYAYRNAGQLDAAFTHYERALTLSPRHRGAHEYVGEAFLIINNLAKAEEHLAALQQICLIPCEEFGELKEKIEAYKRAGKR